MAFSNHTARKWARLLAPPEAPMAVSQCSPPLLPHSGLWGAPPTSPHHPFPAGLFASCTCQDLSIAYRCHSSYPCIGFPFSFRGEVGGGPPFPPPLFFPPLFFSHTAQPEQPADPQPPQRTQQPQPWSGAAATHRLISSYLEGYLTAVVFCFIEGF